MRLLTLLLIPIISGCSTVAAPVKHSLPDMPVALIDKCPELKQLPEGEDRLSEFLKIVSQNYSMYHECSAKQELIVKWYTEQKIVHDTIFNKK